MAGVQGCAVRKLVKLGYRNIALTAIAAARVAACVGVHAKRCRPLHGEHAAHSAQYTNGGSALDSRGQKKIELFTSLKSPIAVSARSCFARASAREV